MEAIIKSIVLLFTSHPNRLVAKIPADIMAEKSIPSAPRIEMVDVSPASLFVLTTTQ